MRTALLALLCATCASLSLHAEDAPAAPVVGTATGASTAKPRGPSPAALALFRNPDAWIVPATHVAFVNHRGAVDAAWLDELAATLQRELRMAVKVVPSDAEGVADSLALAGQVRAALPAEAKVFVVLTRLAGDPVLASPQKGWAVMNVDWVNAAPADEAKRKERMAKQVYRALGFALGAGLRMEPQAVMHPAASPLDLDSALSHNYHPQNLSVVLTMAKALGVEAIRMKPRAELEALGLLPPRKPAGPATAEKQPDAPVPAAP